MNGHDFSTSVVKLWNEWEVRGMVLLSLLLQIFLTITGRRRYTAVILLGVFVWLAYLSADTLAIATLGLLARSQAGSESNGTGSTTSNASFIPAFWAPMLLVHLGGPETITAYALEDNELWSRHLLQLLTQLAVAFYATLRSWWSKDPLMYLVIPIFISGMIKYGERIWVLWLACSEQLRRAALDHHFNDEKFQFHGILPESRYLHESHFLFKILKLLFVDFHIEYDTHKSSYDIFLQYRQRASEAFKLIEVELGFMFDILYTKVMTSVYCKSRFILRFINFLSSVSALLAFSIVTSRNFHAYSKKDIIISYLLLVGAILLDIYSAILMLFSDWAMLWLSKQRKPLALSTYRVISSSRMQSFFSNHRRWKSSMAQYEPLYNPGLVFRNAMIYGSGNIQRWEVIGDDLKELIFNHLLEKRSRFGKTQMRENDLKIILEQRGDGVLREKNCLGELGRTVSADVYFCDSLLLWYLATNIFFTENSCHSKHRAMSISLSRYMMYLQSNLPFMLPKVLGEANYQAFSKEFKNFFLIHAQQAVQNYDRRVADLLKNLQIDGQTLTDEYKWEMISEVWVEMLCYAASHCGWREHAKALAHGGELLTFVAILMSHLGLNYEQCLYPIADQQEQRNENRGGGAQELFDSLRHRACEIKENNRDFLNSIGPFFREKVGNIFN